MFSLQVGRYESPEEIPFFPDNLPTSVLPPHNSPGVLHPAGASININKTIWDLYFNQLLPMFVPEGNDGKYVPTAVCDLLCLQALSRRIHYGKFVAEVKFVEAPEEYGLPIRSKDRDTLMKLLTFESVQEMVQKRVEKKAMVFGQQVSLEGCDKPAKYKVDPSVVLHLYKEWVIPLTKLVEVEYFLRRLD
ncbi:Chorismate mutase 2 [Sarracenia purpurea var. burkii]